MKTTDILLKDIAKELGLSKKNILKSKTRIAASARGMFCMLANEFLNETNDSISKAMGWKRSTCYSSAKSAHELCKYDKIWRRHVDNVSIRLYKRPFYYIKNLIKSGVDENYNVTARNMSKNPFGIVYDDKDVIMINEAKKRAYAFFESYGQGDQTLLAGFPITRMNA